MKITRQALENLLRSGEYLVRGVREGDLVLSEGGGLWATDGVELAFSFGDKLELVRKPLNVLESDMFSLAAMVGKDDFSELARDEWSQIRELLLYKGYDVVNLGEGHMDGAHDFWVLRDDVERIPVDLVGSEGEI